MGIDRDKLRGHKLADKTYVRRLKVYFSNLDSFNQFPPNNQVCKRNKLGNVWVFVQISCTKTQMLPNLFLFVPLANDTYQLKTSELVPFWQSSLATSCCCCSCCWPCCCCSCPRPPLWARPPRTPWRSPTPRPRIGEADFLCSADRGLEARMKWKRMEAAVAVGGE